MRKEKLIMGIYDYLTPHDIVNFIPIEIYHSKDLNLNPKLLFAVISKLCYGIKSDNIDVTNDELAHIFGKSKETIRRYLKCLEKLGFIRVELVYDERYGFKNILGKKIYLTKKIKCVEG